MNVMWNGTIILIFTSMLGSPTPVPTYVQVTAYFLS